jgi:uncharacterized lipoprotein
MKIKMMAVLAVSSLCLTACASFSGNNALLRNHENDYLNSENLPPLRIPPGVSMYPPDTYYTIPYEPQGPAAQVSMLPPGSNIVVQPKAKQTGVKHAKR